MPAVPLAAGAGGTAAGVGAGVALAPARPAGGAFGVRGALGERGARLVRAAVVVFFAGRAATVFRVARLVVELAFGAPARAGFPLRTAGFAFDLVAAGLRAVAFCRAAGFVLRAVLFERFVLAISNHL